MAASVAKKTVETTFLDFRSSCPEVFSNICENCKENILGRVLLLVKPKRVYYHECFPENFLEFFRTTILKSNSG